MWKVVKAHSTVAAEAPHVPGALCLAAYARFKPLRTNESQARTPTVWYLGYGDL